MNSLEGHKSFVRLCEPFCSAWEWENLHCERAVHHVVIVRIWHQYTSFPQSLMETVHAVVLLNQAIWSRGNWMIGLWISFSHTCLGDVTNKPLKDFFFFFFIYSLLHRFKSKYRSVDWLTQSNCDCCFCSEFQSLPHMAAAFYDDKDNKPRNRASKSMDLG